MKNLKEAIESAHGLFAVSEEELREIVREANEKVISGGDIQAFDIQRSSGDDRAFNVSYSFNGWSYHSITLYIR